VALVRVPFYFINLLPTSLLYISILLLVCRFLRPQAAHSLVSRIDDVEYVIPCSEQGAYGNITERFVTAKLRGVQSHQFFLTTLPLPTARAPAHKGNIDQRLMLPQASKLIHYTLPEKVWVRRWGIRNERGEEYDEILDEDEDAQPAKQGGARAGAVVFSDAAAGKRAQAVFIDDGTRPPRAAFMDLDSGGAASGKRRRPMSCVTVVYCKRKRNILWNVRVFRGIIEALKQQPRPI
jgi:hypothetical protein